MNDRAIAISELKRLRDGYNTEIEKLTAQSVALTDTIQRLGGEGKPSKSSTRKKHTLSPAHIAKMQEGRRKARVNGAEPGAEAVPMSEAAEA